MSAFLKGINSDVMSCDVLQAGLVLKSLVHFVNCGSELLTFIKRANVTEVTDDQSQTLSCSHLYWLLKIGF